MDSTTTAMVMGSVLLVSTVAATILIVSSSKRKQKQQVQQPQQQSARLLANGPSDANPVPSSVAQGKQVGASLRDPQQKGKCTIYKNRKAACGGPGCDKTLPSCPGYQKGVNESRYSVALISKPTGITNKSAAVTNGLDPQGILNIVNKLRAQIGAQPVVWDDTLACASTAWAPMTNFDTCPHGAAPGFPYYPQVVGASADLTKTPMQVAEEAISQLMWAQEKPMADQEKITPVSSKLKAGWKKCGQINTYGFDIGHYCVLGDDSLRCCGFGYGLNYAKSGYITTPQTVTPIIVGHFA